MENWRRVQAAQLPRDGDVVYQVRALFITFEVLLEQ